MLICLRMERVYIIKWYETLAAPTIIIGGTGRYIIRLRTFFGILEFYTWGEPKMATGGTDVFVWAPRKMRIWKN